MNTFTVGIYGADKSVNSLLQRKDYRLIKEQSFIINLENWGKVKFLSVENGLRTFFYLTDTRENIVYEFPETTVSTWITEKINAVSFKDIDGDSLKDVIILGEYSSGVGSDGMIPFKYCTIYFQKGKTFVNVDSVDDIFNNKEANLRDIKTIVKVAATNQSKIKKILVENQKSKRNH